MGRGISLTDHFDAVMGSRRGVRNWDHAHGLEYPKTIDLHLRSYEIGSMKSGDGAFDEQTNSQNVIIAPVPTKKGSSLKTATITGAHIRQLRPASRPPGPNNPTAMRKRDLTRLAPGAMNGDEWFAAGDKHVLAFIEEITKRMPIKAYLLFHEEGGSIVTHAYLITDEEDYFLQSFGEEHRVLEACVPYLARRS